MHKTTTSRPSVFIFLMLLFSLPPLQAQVKSNLTDAQIKEIFTEEVMKNSDIPFAEWEQIYYDLETISIRANYPLVGLVGLILNKSGWFSSEVCREGNNLVGLKALRDWEGRPIMYKSTAADSYNEPFSAAAGPYRVYSSYTECIYDLADFLTHPRYVPLQNTVGVRDFLETLTACGFSEDENSADQIIDMLIRIGVMEKESDREVYLPAPRYTSLRL